MLSVPPRRAYALGLMVAVALLVVVGAAPSAWAKPPSVAPAAVMTTTVVLNKAAYLSGDAAVASVIVYRTPSPGNYTYNWTVRDSFFRIVNTTANAAASFTYAIPLNYTGLLTFQSRVDDGQGLIINSQRSVGVNIAVMSLRLDRGDFAPGDTILASYSVTSHVITRPTYDYEVSDTSAVVVFSGTTNDTFIAFKTPAVASRTYAFLVTAREGSNSTNARVTISQVSGALLGVTFDKSSYSPGEIIHAHLSIGPRGTTALPLQFTWTLSLGLPFSGAPTVSAITTTPETDLSLPIPQGVGTGDILIFATEASTGTFQYHTVNIGTTSSLWTTELGGVPLFAVLLGLLFILLLVAVLGLWRRVGGGHLMGPRATAPPPPPGGPTQTQPTAPMSVICRHCGKSIDLTTSKRPIEVMCPSCGETQLVT
jgi:hypothetical protein